MYKDLIIGKKAVIFDFDGTIVDTISYWQDAFNIVLGNIGSIYSAEDLIPLGPSAKDIWERAIDIGYIHQKGLTATELIKQTHNEFIQLISADENFSPRAGFWPLVFELKEEKHMKLALVSNTDRVVIKSALEKLIMSNLFDVTICGDEVTYRKPNPEIYKKAIEQLGVKKSEVLVFEDFGAGTTAAYNAGLDIVAIWDAQISKLEYPDTTKEFMMDFSPLVGNLDLTKKEYYEKQLGTLPQIDL